MQDAELRHFLTGLSSVKHSLLQAATEAQRWPVKNVACTGGTANTGVAPSATGLSLPLELIVASRIKSADVILWCRP